jgi:hypothetical protein
MRGGQIPQPQVEFAPGPPPSFEPKDILISPPMIDFTVDLSRELSAIPLFLAVPAAILAAIMALRRRQMDRVTLKPGDADQASRVIPLGADGKGGIMSRDK